MTEHAPRDRTDADAMQPLRVVDLGRMAYAAALELQRSTQAALVASRDAAGASAPMTAFLVEHDPPVITVSRRPDAVHHLLASPERLAALGVEVAETDRGGDITWHGPGQLVVYPILDLNRLGLRIHSYMRFLESVVIDVLAAHGIVGHRDACATGVWVGGAEPGPGAQGDPAGSDPAAGACASAAGRKICAMGVRVSRWVSMHGLALNVDPDLAHFGLIVPCGLAGRPVTSMAAERAAAGRACPSMDEVKRTMGDFLARAVAAAEATPRRAG